VRLAEPVDQATGLRRLFAGSQVFRAAGVMGPDARRNARVCAELARGLSRRGNQVLVLDEARPPYNVGGMWGLLARHTLADMSRMRLADTVLDAGPGIRLLSAPEGMDTLAGLNERALMDIASHWDDAPEWMLLNSQSAVSGRANTGLATTAEIRVLVLPADKNRLADAYATLKSAHATWSGGTWVVLVDGADPDRAAPLYSSLKETAMRFLGVEPGYLGCLPKTKSESGNPGVADEGVYGAALAESLQTLQTEQSINFEQYWQRMWLFSRMALDSVGGKRRHADRYPG